MLDRIIAEKWLTANGVFGFFPASAVGDDIEVYTDDSRTEVLTTLHNLRQQGEHRDGVPNRSLGDFVAPRETGLADHVGAFAVTAGLGRPGPHRRSSRRPTTTTPRSCSRRWPTGSPRRSRSGCTSGSAPSSGATPRTRSCANEDLIAERYQRHPAGAGLPRLPRAHREADPLGAARRAGQHRDRAHREHGDVAGRGGVRLVLQPPAVAVLRGRPAGRDQVADYAERKGWTLAEAERWLSPNLGYDPDD